MSTQEDNLAITYLAFVQALAVRSHSLVENRNKAKLGLTFANFALFQNSSYTRQQCHYGKILQKYSIVPFMSNVTVMDLKEIDREEWESEIGMILLELQRVCWWFLFEWKIVFSVWNTAYLGLFKAARTTQIRNTVDLWRSEQKSGFHSNSCWSV